MGEIQILIETQLQTPGEIAFAHHFFEEAKNLQKLLYGVISAKLLRNPSGSLYARLYWKDREVTTITFCPDYRSERSNFMFTNYHNQYVPGGECLSWTEWFAKFLKPTVTGIAEQDLLDCVNVLSRLNTETARRFDNLLRELHPHWYYPDC